MAGNRRISTGQAPGEHIPKHIITDHDWVRQNQTELLKKYGPCFLIVYHEQVIGSGLTEEEAVAHAESNLPDSVETIEVMPEWIGRRFTILSLRRADNES